MSITYTDVHNAYRDARETIDRVDALTRMGAGMMRGRLRLADVDRDVLADLKRELQDFDLRSRQWKART